MELAGTFSFTRTFIEAILIRNRFVMSLALYSKIDANFSNKRLDCRGMNSSRTRIHWQTMEIEICFFSKSVLLHAPKDFIIFLCSFHFGNGFGNSFCQSMNSNRMYNFYQQKFCQNKLKYHSMLQNFGGSTVKTKTI